MRALIIHPDEGVRSGIEEALRAVSDRAPAVHQASSPGEGLSAARWFGPDLVLLDLTGDRALALETARELRHSGRFTLGLYNPLLLSGGFDGLRKAARAGVDDFLPVPLSEAELEEALAAHTVATAEGGAEGSLITFASPKGGAGSTTLAINSALVLAGSGVAGSVALCDAVPAFGCVGGYLGIDGSKNLADAVSDDAGVESMGAYLVDAPRPGLKVLAGAPDPARGERLSAEDLSRGLIGLRRSCDVTVVDAPSALDLAALYALDLSDLIFVVTEATAPTVELTGRFLELLESLGFTGDRVRLVLNKHDPKRGTARVAEVGESLGRTVDHAVPWDDAAIAAVHQAEPLLLGEEDSPFAEAVRSIVEDAVQSLRTRKGTAAQ